jgi:hydroxymethylbilane synthase
MSLILRIGARPSALALAQAGLISRSLSQRLSWLKVEIVPIRTSGDKMSTASLAQVGGKGLFIRELEQALSEHRIDLAVHSMKDLPATMPRQFRLAAVPRREASCDVLLALREGGWASRPPGARLGTSSIRRRFQALRVRPNLEVLPLRGNVDTRLRRLRNGDFDAIILAAAGLRRLGLAGNERDAPSLAHALPASLPLDWGRGEVGLGAAEGKREHNDQTARRIDIIELHPQDFVPAGGQGALALEALRDSPIGGSMEIDHTISELTDSLTLAEITAERAFLATIGASCVSPVGVNGSANENLTLRAELFSIDGAQSLSAELTDELPPSSGDPLKQTAESIGERLGRLMLERGAGALIARE